MCGQFQRAWLLLVGCAIVAVAGCSGGGDPAAGGGGDPAVGGGGGKDESKDFVPGGAGVDAGRGKSRFELGNGANGQAAGSSNKSAGTGFGNIVGVTDYWSKQSRTSGRSAETEFETLNESPDVIPPYNWSVRVDPPAEPVTFAPKKKNQKIQIPAAKSRRPSGNAVGFAPVPTGIVTVGYNEAKNDKREIWNLMTGDKVGTVTDIGAATISNTVSPQGKYFAGVVSGSGFEKSVGIYDVEAKQQLPGIALGRTPWFAGIAMPRDDLIVAGFSTGDKLLQAWTLPDCVPAFEVTVATSRKGELPAFSPGGNYIAVARLSDDVWNRNQMITIYSLETGLPEGELELPDYDIGWYLGIQGMAFSPDGKEFAALINGWYCSKILIWSIEDGTIVDHMTFKKKLGEELFGTFAFSKNNVPLSFFPGNRRLLAYELGIIDREIRAGVWKLPKDEIMENNPGTRWPLDESHVTVLTESGRRGFVQVYELPEESIAKSKAQVEKIVSRQPRVPNHLVRPGAARPLDKSGARKIAAAKVPWGVHPSMVAASAARSGSVKLAVSRGTLRQVMMSRSGTPQAFALRSTGWKRGSRLPLGNVEPQSLVQARQMSKPDDDATLQSAVGASKSRSWVDVYDLASGSRVRELRLTYEGDMVSVSPNGKAVLVLAAGSSGRLDLYSTENGEHLGGWEPFGSSMGKNGHVLVSATMPNDTQIVAFSAAGELTAWDTTTGKASFVAYNASQPTCSLDGQYVGYSDGTSFYLVSLATGDLKGVIPDTGDVRAAAFHPNLPKIALLSRHKGGYYLFTTNLETGQVDAPFPVPVISAFLRWFGDKFVLLGNEKLVDTEQRVVVWSYKLPAGDHLPVAPDGRHWFIGNTGGAPVLAAAELPGPQAMSQISAGTLQPEFLLQPGESCSLEFRFNHAGFSSDSRQALEKRVRAQLAANRITVAGGQPVRLVISVNETIGESMSLRFRSFGGGFNAEAEEVSLPVRTTVFRAAYLSGASTAWVWKGAVSNRSHAYFVSKKDGESVQQAIERSYTSSLQNGFNGLVLPPYVFTPKSANGLGETALIAP